jgi:hypothetical protein
MERNAQGQFVAKDQAPATQQPSGSVAYNFGHAAASFTKNSVDNVALAGYGAQDAWVQPKVPFADKLAAARAAHSVAK